MTRAVAVTEGTLHAPHPATAAAHAAFWLTDVPHHLLCHNTPHRHSCTPSQTCHFSNHCHLHHYSMDHSWSCSSNSHHTAWGPQPMKKAKPHPRLSTPIIPTIPRLLASRTSNQILPQIQTMTDSLDY